MSDRKAKGCLLAAIIWCVILGLLAVAYKFLVHPYLQERLTTETGSESQYRNEIVVAADSFSGYAILRSDEIRNSLKSQQIKLTVQDDGADYAARLRALSSGDVQMAVFTIDSLISASVDAGEFPASIVLVIDETKGGDAMLAYTNTVARLEDLNHADARISLTPSSPSEFLSRVVIAHFNLPNLPQNWAENRDGAADVYQQFIEGNKTSRTAYVMWEPYVSRALQQEGAHVLIDSSKLKGFIVDVLVARREFLRDHPELVRKVIEAYARAAYSNEQKPNGMVDLVRSDAQQTGLDALNEEQAKKVVDGIRWKNTLENYAHFGILSGASQGGLQTLEDMIGNIVDVLVKTGAISAPPMNGQFEALYYDGVLREMRSSDFHPAKGQTFVNGLGPGSNELRKVRAENEAAALTPDQWVRLNTVGELRVTSIEFGRGSASINIGSRRSLESLAERLRAFPMYYLRILGHTRAVGDPEANRILAQDRADAAADFLKAQGLSANRIQTEAAPSSVTVGQGQAVSFIVGQLPY